MTDINLFACVWQWHSRMVESGVFLKLPPQKKKREQRIKQENEEQHVKRNVPAGVEPKKVVGKVLLASTLSRIFLIPQTFFSLRHHICIS